MKVKSFFTDTGSAKLFILLLSLASPLPGFIHQKSKLRYELVPSETGVLTSTVFWYPCLNLHQTGVILNSHKKWPLFETYDETWGKLAFDLRLYLRPSKGYLNATDRIYNQSHIY